jgi:hypothetical protein
VRSKTLKVVQERSGNTLEVIVAAQQLRETIDKWDFKKLKGFYTTKEMVSKLKRPLTELEEIFASYTSDKVLITRLYRKLKKLNSLKNQ